MKKAFSKDLGNSLPKWMMDYRQLVLDVADLTQAFRRHSGNRRLASRLL